jgi:hypothetical protein
MQSILFGKERVAIFSQSKQTNGTLFHFLGNRIHAR